MRNLDYHGRPKRLMAIADDLDKLTERLEREGFAWAPETLTAVVKEIRGHVEAIRGREGVRADA